MVSHTDEGQVAENILCTATKNYWVKLLKNIILSVTLLSPPRAQWQP